MDVLYSNTFWTAISASAAVIAIVLSQMQPLKIFSKRKKPLLTFPVQCAVTHYIGKPSLNIFIGIDNESRHDIKIVSIKSIIKKSSDKSSIELPINAYFGTSPQDQMLKSFIPFTLKAGSSWANNLQFYTPIAGESDNNLRKIIKIYKEIKAENATSPNRINYFEHDSELEKKIDSLFKANKYWTEGQYHINLEIKTTNEKCSINAAFDFYLYQIDIQTMEEMFKHDVMYGGSILYQTIDHIVYPSINMER
ncbi:hypothetical protein EX227_15330 [Providencia rettgeri]|uniref:Uncharacterized protein n=1 Tax=Providencia rettgeri TaxID=587 RepID=A0AAP2JU70_PRORE|nr:MULTISPECIES: hypothetical protein [Providencia]ELR5132263.1 hypothetical protein [Providencia rettgeri]ELR5198313.1 hypothetical protein [Providencia rettgeri]EMB3081989.1 hypothetical protein [Providencia rettgeri]MBX6953363.1 hypothetical protein [Providencia rettgeri]MBX6954520.1 hypothetical protein [Providencia rettgeri]